MNIYRNPSIRGGKTYYDHRKRQRKRSHCGKFNNTDKYLLITRPVMAPKGQVVGLLQEVNAAAAATGTTVSHVLQHQQQARPVTINSGEVILGHMLQHQGMTITATIKMLIKTTLDLQVIKDPAGINKFTKNIKTPKSVV